MRTPPDDVLPIRRQALRPFVLHAALLLVVILTACSQSQSGSTTSGGTAPGVLAAQQPQPLLRRRLRWRRGPTPHCPCRSNRASMP